MIQVFSRDVVCATDALLPSCLEGRSYLAGSEADPVVELHPFFFLSIVQLLPTNAHRHGSKIVIHTKIVLMFCKCGRNP